MTSPGFQALPGPGRTPSAFIFLRRLAFAHFELRVCF